MKSRLECFELGTSCEYVTLEFFLSKFQDQILTDILFNKILNCQKKIINKYHHLIKKLSPIKLVLTFFKKQIVKALRTEKNYKIFSSKRKSSLCSVSGKKWRFPHLFKPHWTHNCSHNFYLMHLQYGVGQSKNLLS